MKKTFLILICMLLVILVIGGIVFFQHQHSAKWQEIAKGYEDKEMITYEQFLKLLMTAHNPDLDFELIQLEDEYNAGPYVELAGSYGLLYNEEDIAEKLDEPITRIKVAKFLSLSDMNIRNTPQMYQEEISFSDLEDISEMEDLLLQHAIARGFMQGNSNGMFEPNAFLTVGEAVKILSTYMDS